MKPKLPKDEIKIQLGGIPAHLTLDTDRFSSGGFAMTFSDTTADIVNVDDANGTKTPLGRVSGTIGGGVEVVIGNRHWRIRAIDLFNAVRDAEINYTKFYPILKDD